MKLKMPCVCVYFGCSHPAGLPTSALLGVSMQLSVGSVCQLWNVTVNGPLCLHCMMLLLPTCASTQDESPTNIQLSLSNSQEFF